MTLLLLAVAAASTPTPPSAEALAARWAELRPALDQHSMMRVPTMSDEDWARVASGKVARHRLPGEGDVDAAVGVGWVPYAPADVWVGALDDLHNQLSDRLTELWLPESTPGRKVLYQHLDVPAPFSDRHWVLVVQNNPALYAATAGAVWERGWSLDGRDPVAVAASLGFDPGEAVATPVNDGGWSLIPMGDGALVVYEVRSDIGGYVPEDVIFQFVLSSLDQMVDKLAEPARAAPAHYEADHAPILLPDGKPIAPGSLK